MTIETETPAVVPTVTPAAVETARWYTVRDAELMTDAQGREFTPAWLKVWDRPFRGWVVVIYGRCVDGGQYAAKVFTADHDARLLPVWARRLLPGRPPITIKKLMDQIERYAHYYVDLPYLDAERDDIERQLLALSIVGDASERDRATAAAEIELLLAGGRAS